MRTQVSKNEFIKMPQEEQNYLIFGAVEGIDKRVTILERQKWWKSSLSFVGGIPGGIIAMVGLK